MNLKSNYYEFMHKIKPLVNLFQNAIVYALWILIISFAFDININRIQSKENSTHFNKNMQCHSPSDNKYLLNDNNL